MKERTGPGLVAWALLLGPLLLGSCRKERPSPTWDVDLAVPLVHTTLGLGDLIADSLLQIGADGNVTLLYSTRLFALKLDTILSAPDTSFRYKYPPFDLGSATLDIFAGTQFQAVNDVNRFELEDLELRDLRVRTGRMSVVLTNRLATTILCSFSLPAADLNGSVLGLQTSVQSGSAASPSVHTDLIALDGYHFDLRGPAFNEVNTLATMLSLTTDPGGPNVVMSNADSVEALVSYADIVPAYARGYFGTRLIELDPDTVTLDLFNGVAGLLDIADAAARLHVRNGIGVDVRARIERIRGINSRTGAQLDLTHTITTSSLNVDRALDLGGSFQAAQNNWTIASANSNIVPFVELLPDRIAYDLNVTIAPLGDVSNGNDFFYYESDLAADLDVEIPLRLAASDLTLSKTTRLDLGGTLENHALQSGTLHVFTTNRFPFSAEIRLVIVDLEGNVLAELPQGGTVASAEVNANGVVTSGVETQLDFTITKDQLDLFYAGSSAGPEGAQLRILSTLNTANQPDLVQLRYEHTMSITVSLEGNYIVNGDE
jgi:hypothetical protein